MRGVKEPRRARAGSSDGVLHNLMVEVDQPGKQGGTKHESISYLYKGEGFKELERGRRDRGRGAEGVEDGGERVNRITLYR